MTTRITLGTRDATPNPGHPSAIDLGCTCPVEANHCGDGIDPFEPVPVHHVDEDCPLHTLWGGWQAERDLRPLRLIRGGKA